MSGEGTYECTLDKETLKKAQKELNEDPKQRASHIEAFREWVKKQPHLRSRTDDHFLLRYLRVAKFSQLRAQDMLDNFWTVRSVDSKGAPDWFKNMDPTDPKVNEVLDLAVQFPLPGYDPQGRKVVYISTGGYDPQIHDFGDIMKIGFMTTDILLLDEKVQVHGVTILLDFTEFSASHVWYWTPDTVKKAMRCWQDVYPTRNKSINYYNTPTLFNAVFEIFKYFMKEKLKKRLHFHKGSLESLHKQVPKEMLPEELGGTAGTKAEINKKWKEHLIANKAEFELNAQCGVDEDKRIAQEVQAAGSTDAGVTGSFRKLAVD